MNKCPRCSAAISDDVSNCLACGLSLRSEPDETAVLPPDPQADTPTKLETGSKRNNTPMTTTTGGGARFVSGTVLAGRYRIVGLIGKGGMGEVYKAEDLELEQTVALKFLPEELAKNEDLLRRFRGEVRNARQVSHPNVCRVFDIGETEGLYYLTMEYIDGDDLSMLLKRIGRFPSDRAVEVSRQICTGLAAIHKAGILHRDLKPANIIIDSKGEARITDFGIAGLEAEVQGFEARVGTPAYMSPEQADGKELTKQSDIYSLGLLLYEIFTGAQAFEGESVQELRIKHATTTPREPSAIVAGIDPVVERVINRCLEKAPEDRPISALHVALSLPGGNPLEAAIAAGETPSPEMVAAAPKKGALKPSLALGVLLAFFAIFIFFSYQQHVSKFFNIVPPEKPREVLAERSRAIVEKFGYGDPTAHAVYGFQEDEDFIGYANTNLVNNRTTHSETRLTLASGQARILSFFYRQSPEYLEPKETEKVTSSDPSFDVADMVNVKLDATGRLIEFAAVPPAVADQLVEREADWESLFTEAGLDRSRFEETKVSRTPPVFADQKRSWLGSSASLPDVTLRIEAASFNGKPVFFKVVAPWNEKAAETRKSENIYRKAGVFLVILIHFAAICGSLLLVRRNLKAGRGDLRGALKLTIFLFLLYFARSFIYADHVPTIWGELTIFYNIFAYSLVVALFTGLMYLALEPFVRRYWSELLISWNRLLSGDLRDPLIGRDVLFGLILGMGHTFGIFVGSVVFSLATGNEGILSDNHHLKAINGVAGMISAFLDNLPSSVTNAFIMLFLLIGFYILTKKKSTSIVLLFVLAFGIQGLIFVLTQHWAYIFAAIINAACMCLAIYRFGLVGTLAFWLGFFLTYVMPLTFHTSSLYFPATVATYVFVFALAIYAFYISIAGQSIFRGTMIEDLDR